MRAMNADVLCLRASNQRAGFTLVEVIISVSLMALVLGSAYACLHAGFAARQLVEPRADALQTARVVLGLITADLRNACPLPGDSEFIGMKRTLDGIEIGNIDFATHNYSPARPGEGDFCEVSIYADKNPEDGQLSLWRRRNPRIGMDPLAGGHREELANGIRGLSFEFYDGIDWYDTWGDPEARRKYEGSARYRGNLSGLPEAVRISISVASEPNRKQQDGSLEQGPDLVFRSLVKLNLARSAAQTSASAATNSASTGQPGAAPAPMQPGGPE